MRSESPTIYADSGGAGQPVGEKRGPLLTELLTDVDGGHSRIAISRSGQDRIWPLTCTNSSAPGQNRTADTRFRKPRRRSRDDVGKQRIAAVASENAVRSFPDTTDCFGTSHGQMTAT